MDHATKLHYYWCAHNTHTFEVASISVLSIVYRGLMRGKLSVCHGFSLRLAFHLFRAKTQHRIGAAVCFAFDLHSDSCACFRIHKIYWLQGYDFIGRVQNHYILEVYTSIQFVTGMFYNCYEVLNSVKHAYILHTCVLSRFSCVLSRFSNILCQMLSIIFWQGHKWNSFGLLCFGAEANLLNNRKWRFLKKQAILAVAVYQ
jgi:hypothetical protein